MKTFIYMGFEFQPLRQLTRFEKTSKDSILYKKLDFIHEYNFAEFMNAADEVGAKRIEVFKFKDQLVVPGLKHLYKLIYLNPNSMYNSKKV